MKKIKIIHEVRAVKNKRELANIIKAQRISEQVLRQVVAKLKTGVSEIQIANLIKKFFIKHRVHILSFPPIVSFGRTFLIHSNTAGVVTSVSLSS